MHRRVMLNPYRTRYGRRPWPVPMVRGTVSPGRGLASHPRRPLTSNVRLHERFQSMRISYSLFLSTWLAACAQVPVPTEQASQKTFTRSSTLGYQDAYRVIAKQLRACYRAIGLFGNGYDIQADLDTHAKTGTVELYPVGLTGAQKAEASIFSRTVTIVQTESGSRITTTGTTPQYVYQTHMTIPAWLEGADTCSPRAP